MKRPFKSPTWHTKEGFKVRMMDMSDQHLMNAIKMTRKNCTAIRGEIEDTGDWFEDEFLEAQSVLEKYELTLKNLLQEKHYRDQVAFEGDDDILDADIEPKPKKKIIKPQSFMDMLESI